VAAELTGIALTMAMSSASKSVVMPLSGLAQGAETILMPQLSQLTRGTRALSKASGWKKF
jgi:hypothetical protein